MKRELFEGFVSLTAAKAVWTEIGREFKSGDRIHGEVGLVTSIGRIAIKGTAAYLTYILTDCVVTKAVDSLFPKTEEGEDHIEEPEQEHVEEDVPLEELDIDFEEEGDEEDGEPV
jgi:hypothetical protein